MTVPLSPFMTCNCGKLHLRSYLSPLSVCTCGANLWALAWGMDRGDE